MALLDLLKRAEKGSPLNATEHDVNFTAIETAVNAAQTINGHIETVANKTYRLVLKTATARTISSITLHRGSGTCTVAIQIDGTPVTWTGSVTTLSVTATETETNALSANTAAAGTTVDLVVTGNSACLDFWFSLKVTP